MQNTLSIGAELLQLRLKAGFTQQEVANCIGANVASICRWENGERRPKHDKLEKLSALYHCTVGGVDAIPGRKLTFGEKLREHRVNAGYSLEQVAKQLHVTTTMVCRWETDAVVPKPDKLKKLADLYQCSVAGMEPTDSENTPQGEKLKEFRLRANLSQVQAAEILNCKQKDLSRWENNVIAPKIENLKKIAAAYHCSVNDLI